MHANELPVTSMTLPEALSSAVSAWLEREGLGGRRLSAAANTAIYRDGGTSARIDLSAYLVARLPATHAAVTKVLGELASRRPGFSPTSLLDVGAGPGTASWAAAAQWPGIEAVTFLDTDRRFLKLAGDLAASGPPALAAARSLTGTIEAMPAGLSAELVVAAYTLAELPLARMAKAAEALWGAAQSTLVVVEPGTPTGFARLAAVRETLLRAGAVAVAPCPHAGTCPMTGGDWCHFSVRLARSRAHMHAKAAVAPFEDEKFAYLAVSRDGALSGGARVLSPPIARKPGITFSLCTKAGLETRHIARRDAEAYKINRKKGWGDLLA